MIGVPGPVGPAGERGYPGMTLFLWEKKWHTIEISILL
jgi:hypothetical protein